MKETANFLGDPDLTLYEVKNHSKEWYEFRERGLGGSDAPTVLGANKYRSKLQLFLEKIGYYKESKKNLAPLVWGTVLEHTVLDMWRYLDNKKDGYLDRYESKNPYRKLREIEGYIVNSQFPWLYHSVDALIPPGQVCPYTGEVVETFRILEAKTIDPNHARQWEKGYPEYYRFQVQQYMLGLKLPSAEMVIFSLDRRLYGDVIYEDIDEQKDILEKSHDLWGRVIKGREIMSAGYGEDRLLQELGHIQPELGDDNPYSLNEFLSRNAKMKEEMSVIAPENVRRAAVNLQKIVKMTSWIAKQKELYEVEIRHFMNKEQAYNIDFQDDLGESLGYLRVSSRANSDKLTINNRIKADHKDALQQLEGLIESVRL